MLSVEIIGAIDQLPHYDSSYIIQLLRANCETLLLGSDFIGRPGTRIYADEQHVIKIRTEFNFATKQARRWALQTLHKEQQLAVHHPHKTWLLITEAIDDTLAEQVVLIASICPRLKPLHIELKTPPIAPTDRRRYLNLFKAVFAMYLNLAKTSDTKLDEGLSNFAVDGDDKIYYLDDEYYSWDRFVTFSIMLGVYIRSFEWLDEAFINELAFILIEQLDSVFQEHHCRQIIARQLHSLFMPQGQKEHLLHTLMNALLNQPKRNPEAIDDFAINKLAPQIATPIIEQANNTSSANSPISKRFVALLADIHSNYAALCCVLDYLQANGIDEGIVLGDVVGYGPDPIECIERLQNSNFRVIKGNHDHAVGIGSVDIGFSGHSRKVIEWTIAQLSIAQRHWLNDLPVFEETKEWFAVHGAPMDPEFFYAYVYMMTYEDNLAYMASKNMSLCFHGHSHMPGVFARDHNGRDLQLSGKKIALGAYAHILVCPGSIGQPRNGCPDAQFAIYDRELREVSFMSLPYPVESVMQKMRSVGLPEELAQRLLIGR